LEPKPVQLPEPTSSERPVSPVVIGRYVLHARIARGGMATIHIARLTGAEGFSRIVAAKRLHPQYIEDADFVSMFLDEARIASKVHHPNVVPVLDVVSTGSEIVLVQEYIHGVPLQFLLKTARKLQQPVPVPIVVAIMKGVLAGLHAAHEARDELGQPLHIVHRDVSPQNVMIGIDGAPRLLDFGVAKATLSAHVTREGTFKGKIAYTAPEQLRGHATRASDIYAAGIVMWEALVGRGLHQGQPDTVVMSKIVNGDLPCITEALQETRASIPQERWEQLVALEPVVARAMSVEASDRFATATEFAAAIRAVVAPAADDQVAQWAQELGKEFLEVRERVIAGEETSWRSGASGPESGSNPVADSLPTNPLRSGVSPSPPKTRDGSQPPWEPRNVRRWLVAMLLLLVVAAGATVVTLVARTPSSAPESTPMQASAPPSVPPLTPVPAAAQSVTVVQEASPSSKPVAATPPAWTSPPPAAHRPAFAYPQRPTSPPPAPAPAPTASASAAAVDCNPPFYFVGKKKVYKDGCL
jgi:serine/threonine protein kinase